MSLQIQITQIGNGFMVASPPSDKQIQTMQQQNRQPEPVINFCKDYFDVCKELERVWPWKIEHTDVKK